MQVCFFNLAHIGDIYIFASFLRHLCNLNKNVKFLYYTIYGDIFFQGINNLYKITQTTTSYSSDLVNGFPPEELLNIDFVRFIKSHIDDKKTCYKVINCNNTPILFINTWILPLSEYLKKDTLDFDYPHYNTLWELLINKINKEFNLNLYYKLENKLDLIINNFREDLVELPSHICINYEKLSDTVFIFNFMPRSVTFNMNYFHNWIKRFSIVNKIMLACYHDDFKNNPNITFFDREYDTKPAPDCSNLIKLWKIAKLCKKIVVVPSGSSWTFLHEMDELLNNKLYIISYGNYSELLNNNIFYFYGIKNCVQNYNL